MRRHSDRVNKYSDRLNKYSDRVNKKSMGAMAWHGGGEKRERTRNTKK